MTKLSTTPTLPWYRSKVIVGAIISFGSKLLVMTGAINELAPEDAETISNMIVLAGGFVGDFLAIYARATQKSAPKITAKVDPRTVVGIAAALMVCGPMIGACAAIPAVPVASSTTIDERALVTAQGAYTVASTAYLEADRVDGWKLLPEAARIPTRLKARGLLIDAANALRLARQAQIAANAGNFQQQLAAANAAIKQAQSLIPEGN
jgi:hypothetical protein